MVEEKRIWILSKNILVKILSERFKKIFENNNPKTKCDANTFCITCQEIVNSNHIDILEMDAASKTGIDDVRELIENSKYSPTSANFKIFKIQLYVLHNNCICSKKEKM